MTGILQRDHFSKICHKRKACGAFQLIGKAAKTQASNFNDWEYNGSQWLDGTRQNLAGQGQVNALGGENAIQEGEPELYLEGWAADSTTKILDHWFGAGGIGLERSGIRYWNMDNEAEIWADTHDDVVSSPITAEAFMQRYFAVARKAREKFPEVKLVGPVTANEWQWYDWNNTPISDSGKKYPWLEFFIKRVAEEQKASGVRLLDVLDIHFYPGSTVASNVVQYHRVFFDSTYVFPEANGVKNVGGSWNDAENREYIFQRCRKWLDTYIGPDHGVRFSVAETGVSDVGANAIAVWYASTLGEFMEQPDMELFSPWHWYPAMWEVLHLYSRYSKMQFVRATSSEEEFVSAYPTINAGGDSLTVVLVNRNMSRSRNVNLDVKGFALSDGPFDVLRLSNLPSQETFVSYQSNALKRTVLAKVSGT